MSKKDFLIFSPHLDDAALSCADHAISWLKEGADVHCVTVFSNFGTGEASEYQRGFMVEQGFKSVRDLERSRIREDVEAMKVLGLKYEHMGLVDAAFRRNEGSLIYPDYRGLTPWSVDLHSQSVKDDLVNKMRGLRKAGQKVILPLGVGGHIDHWIVRQAAETVWLEEECIYYLDFPYALRPWKYRLKVFPDLILKKKSVKLMSGRKSQSIDCYQSQINYLFRSKPNYPEVLLWPRDYK